MKISSVIYTGYVCLLFFLLCIPFVPILFLLSLNKKWHLSALKLHRLWARCFFTLAFIPVEIRGLEKLNSDEQYIFCCNHFSYLDIPAFCLIWPAKFIGKSSIKRIPLFGHFYANLHVTVDRGSVKSRAESLKKSKSTIIEGFSMTFFPEGGIKVLDHDLPNMVMFREGAFRLATELNKPIIPVVLYNNFEIFPDKNPIRIHRKKCHMEVLDPVYPSANDEKEVVKLKEKVHKAIQEKLNVYHQANVL